jgi:Thymidine kinase
LSIYNNKEFGSITVVWGSMYSGKTEELIRRLKRAQFAGLKYQLFKPAKDDRYGVTKVATHYGNGLDAIVVKNSYELLEKIDPECSVIGIDEGQFFDENLVYVCQELKSKHHIDVIVSGLDMNCFAVPYKNMMELAAISNECIKFKAVCSDCGKDAYISYILIDDNSGEVIGSEGVYIALCEKDYKRRNYLKDKQKMKKHER